MAFENELFKSYYRLLQDLLNAASIEERVVAENFLLEERLNAARENNYTALIGTPTDFSAWNNGHQNYCSGKIKCLVRATVPETFTDLNRSNFLYGLEASQYIIRVENLNALLKVSRLEPETTTYERFIGRLLADKNDAEAKNVVTDFLRSCNANRDFRPLFVGFWGEVRDLFETDDPKWPDKLRDRFGLGHLNPLDGAPIPILVFRYRLSDVNPVNHDVQATIPTVLDSDFSPFFCPTPGKEQKGQILDLSATNVDDYCFSTEILHPFIEYESDFIYRLGHITRAPGSTCETACRIHFSYWSDQFKNFDQIKSNY